MFDQSSRALKIGAVVAFVAILLALAVVFIMQKKSVVQKSGVEPSKTATQSPNGTSMTPANTETGAPTVVDPGTTPPLPTVTVERAPDAPPLISPEEALKLRGIESVPAATAPALPPVPPTATAPVAPEMPVAPPTPPAPAPAPSSGS